MKSIESKTLRKVSELWPLNRDLDESFIRVSVVHPFLIFDFFFFSFDSHSDTSLVVSDSDSFFLL